MVLVCYSTLQVGEITDNILLSISKSCTRHGGTPHMTQLFLSCFLWMADSVNWNNISVFTVFHADHDMLSCNVARVLNFAELQKLAEDKVTLQRRRDVLKRTMQELNSQYEALKTQLAENETYVQVARLICCKLCNLFADVFFLAFSTHWPHQWFCRSLLSTTQT